MLHFPRKLVLDEIFLNVDMPDETDVTANPDDKRWAIIGQERAVQALEMGISLRAKGYNIYVAGESGTGKHTAIMDILSRHRKNNNSLRDIAYVQDFQDPDKPLNLIFPEGRAREFKEDVRLLIGRLSDKISEDLDTESYKARRDTLIAEAENAENKLLADFESQLNAEGFRTVQTDDEDVGRATDIAPVIDGETVLFDDLQDLVLAGRIDKSVWSETRERYFAYLDAMKRIYRELRRSGELLNETLIKLKNDIIQPGVHELCAALAERWADTAVKKYLESLEADVLTNSDWFISDEDQEEGVDLSVRYGVHIVLDRHGVAELPIIHETNPTKINLFGAIEARYDVSGELRTNMMMIKAGSLIEADGGFLIIQAEDIFSKEGLWPELKRALQTGHVVPEVQSTPLGPLPIMMKPEPVVAETTVILVGAARIYESLCTQDEAFLKLFKVAAEFSPVMIREPETEKKYASFARTLASKEGLLPISKDGIREIISYAIMLSSKRDRLSTRFSLISDLIRESHYGAGKSGKNTIDGEAIKKAITTREYLSNLPEEMLIDQIREGTLLIEVDGMKTAVVNGLAVLERGFYAFGTPMRVTVAVGPGKEGLINIERESGLSGELHDKGVLLLEGYLRHRFARRQQISLTASIAVEQSYYEIDGDSASLAELVALLSAISEIPVRQDIAVTGAVNQHGSIQPVGGIYEKVQGFFKACEAKGLTGRQGVVVPARNSGAVILSDKVCTAVKNGRFHIWAAEDIDEVMTLLTGRKAGVQRRGKRFDYNSVNESVRRGLVELSDLS